MYFCAASQVWAKGRQQVPQLGEWTTTAVWRIASRQVAIETLIDALGDADLAIRRAAVIALGVIGPAAEQALPALIKLCKSSEDLLYTRCLEAIEQISAETCWN